MRSFQMLLSLLLLATAAVEISAAAAPAANQKQSPSRASLRLHVSYLVINGETRTAVPLDHQFPTGERLRIEVTTTRAGYLYFLSRATDGKRERLWPPREGALPVHAGQTITVPEHGNFRIQGNREDLIEVIFAVRPLADPVAAAGGQTESRIYQIRLREIELDSQPKTQPGTSFTADLDHRGVAVLELKVRHR